MTSLRQYWLLATVLPGSLMVPSAAPLAELPAPAETTVDFRRDIQPLLAARCISCHGPEKQEGGLRWDQKASALQGGLSGPALTPGSSAQSRMIQLVGGLDPDLVMPPKGPRLTREQISLLRAWIDQGVPWPDNETANEDEHWAFKPAVRYPVPGRPEPAGTHASWPRNPIDNFIYARLRQHGLGPSTEAPRGVLIRRLTFDLHGLPPEPEEVERFVNDGRPDAYEQLVDRLLASPRYGERWARHWLDIVHYGDSHGYDKDKPRPHAWPYRDYVIEALNHDKPYGRFVQEQLAADALYPDEPHLIPALGFIAAGPWDFVGHVELPETKTDGLIARYNDRDDMVMNTMSTFLSLTVHCARCHNHKFDPISQRDYYGLQAVFAGVDRAERDYDPDPRTQARRAALRAERESLAEVLTAISNSLAKMTSPELAAIDARLGEINSALKTLPRSKAESPSNGYHSGIEKEPRTEKWVEVDLGSAYPVDSIKLTPARPTDFPDSPGFGFPRRWRVEIGTAATREVVANYADAPYPNPGTGVVAIALSGQLARVVRVTALELWERTQDWVFALAELEVESGGINVAAGATVRALDSIEAGRWAKGFLVDGYPVRYDPGSSVPARPGNTLSHGAQRESLERERDQLSAERKEAAFRLLAFEERERTQRVTARLTELERELKTLPAPQKVYAATSAFKPEGSFTPARGVRPVHLLRRGDVKSPRELMPPAALSRVPNLVHPFQCADSAEERARRAALARWIADQRNMLARRSIVNRLWQYHFGRGLVESPNDFGKMGSQPSHPELLDWLAYWFLDQGESLKKLHRLIVTSATWRQNSMTHRAEAAAADGDNRFLWRMNRRRLDAEEIRDAVLHASGNLNLKMGGPAVQMFYFKDDHSPVYDYSRYNVDEAAGWRRAVYRFIVRSVPDPLMDCLDAADPNLLVPRRNTTLTALQALSMLNNNFLVRQSEHCAARVGGQEHRLDSQIDTICRRALGRAATAEEAALFQSFVSAHGLPALCRLIFNSNEFIFID